MSSDRPPTSPSSPHDALQPLAERHFLLRPGDPGYEGYRSDLVLEGHPDAVARPKNEAEVADLLTEAAAHAIPVTVAGGRTSVTGSSVAENGLVLAMEGMHRVLDLKRDPETGGMTATADPGIFLGDFQRAMEAEGWYYPPDPTSRDEAQLGATVATNATGEDTLLYGPTRRWVRELRVVLAGGSVRTLRRSRDSRPPEEKATAGYYLEGEEIDLLIGSEGTLGVITGVTVDLIPRPPGVFAGLAYFPTLENALSFVVKARQEPSLRPRALELVDERALRLVEGNPEGIRAPAATGAAVVFKQECKDEQERGRYLEAWLRLLEAHLREAGSPGLADAATLFETGAELLRLRSFRHRIPMAVAETLAARKALGVGKVATDWWVPYERLPAFLDGWMAAIRGSGMDALVFGHVGNGHPHVNFLPGSGEEAERARAMVVRMCREAVALGGGVAGEHGLGKVKRNLLAVQCRPERIAAMRAIKQEWDPSGILGRGNLFPEAAV